jgi:hypothetical protein
VPDLDLNNIFSLSSHPELFDQYCRSVYTFQRDNNPVYREWCRLTGGDTAYDNKTQVFPPALPVSFFKTHSVVCGPFIPEAVFESSGTTGMQTSRHYVKEMDLYRQSFMNGFKQFYGSPGDWCILGLLPSYLERQQSSLVAMVDALIKESEHPDSGFYLYNFSELAGILQLLEAAGQRTMLIGVTFALLDFAAAFPMPLQHTVVMETGGMKGRKKEMTRMEVHAILQEAFSLPAVHSEYGMTELLSQAYSKGAGRFVCPSWMRVLVRDEEDPMLVKTEGRGVLQVIDLANVHSCSFIALEDVGMVYPDGSFEVWGRMDNSDIRGCSLLAV